MYAVPDNPAYIPNLFLDLSHRMSFLQRVENTVLLVVHKLMYSMTMRKTGNELSKKYLGVDILSDMDMEYNSSLFLSNTHFSFTYPRPLPPNVIEVGGIHIAKQKPLPKVSILQELEDITRVKKLLNITGVTKVHCKFIVIIYRYVKMIVNNKFPLFLR